MVDIIPAGYLTRTEWATKIAGSYRQAVEAIIETGRLLVAAKEQLRGDFIAMVEDDLPFGRRRAQQLMAIARNPVLTEAKHVSLLPADSFSVYRLSRLPIVALEQALAEGRIRPDMRRRDVRALQLAVRREAAIIEAEATARPVIHDPGLILGDAREAVRSLENRSVQLVLSDPPYGIGYMSASQDPQLTGPMAGDDENSGELLQDVLQAFEPKLTEDAHCYIFTVLGDPYEAFVRAIRPIFDIRSYIVWVKGKSGLGTKWFGPTTEVIVFGTRGDPPRSLFGRRLSNSVIRGRVRNRIHPTQKPLGILKTLINQSTLEGELVADPFAGSGSTLVAAKQTGRRYWGVELNEQHYRRAQNWLMETTVLDRSLRDAGRDRWVYPAPPPSKMQIAPPDVVITGERGRDRWVYPEPPPSEMQIAPPDVVITGERGRWVMFTPEELYKLLGWKPA